LPVREGLVAPLLFGVALLGAGIALVLNLR
jgi:hypothetical protein